MQHTVKQAATEQVPTPAQDLRTRLERSLTINGQPADRKTIDRIVSACNRPQETDAPCSNLPTREFRLLR